MTSDEGVVVSAAVTDDVIEAVLAEVIDDVPDGELVGDGDEDGDAEDEDVRVDAAERVDVRVTAAVWDVVATADGERVAVLASDGVAAAVCVTVAAAELDGEGVLEDDPELDEEDELQGCTGDGGLVALNRARRIQHHGHGPVRYCPRKHPETITHAEEVGV